MEWVIETTNPKSSTKETKYRCKVCGKEEVVVDEYQA
jgi:transposase-like protein